MPTLFTRIINGEIPGHFVWKDDRVAAFMTIAPLTTGHVLVVPRAEIDHWLDIPPDLLTHLMGVAARIGTGQMAAFAPARIGMIIAGLEVPHAHLHLIPINSERDLDFANADTSATSENLEMAAIRLRDALASNPGVSA